MSRLRAASLGFILSFALLFSLGAGCSRPSTQKSPSASRSDSSLRSSARSQKQGGEEPFIRVRLIERATEFVLAVAGPYEVRQKDEILAQGSNLSKTLVTTVEGQPQRLQIGQLTCPPGPIEIVPRTPGTLRLYFQPPQGAAFSRLYKGYARISCRPPEPGAAANPGGIDLVNVIKLEEYLPSVLQAELYADWHIEAYRAQAVAARTYALYEMRTFGEKRDYDVRATEASQVYRGIDEQGYSKKALRAVRNTRGIVCTWASPLGERIFSTYYSSACGGMTQDAANCFKGPSIPPLAGGVRCSYCNIGGRVYRWEPVRVGKDELTQLFVKRFPKHAGRGTIQTIEVVRST
ncbi:MAG: SpoIID/LytB domain-containing protein, partial [Planctomycetes bacterium]|nr:SpoIID/LytB domain-containing protein [Planctomycetota bacterium]